MPMYEYICEKCGSHIEVLQKLSDPPLKRCTKCRGKLEKTVSRTSFQLKGSGWYVTDFRNGSKPPTKGEAKTDGKTDAKNDAKPVAAEGAKADGAAKPAESGSESKAAKAEAAKPAPATPKPTSSE